MWSPFVIAPVPQKQDSLLLYYKDLLSIEGKILKAIYGQSPDYSKNNISIFPIGKKICFCISLPSASSVEVESGRSGLTLTLGLLICKDYFKKIQNILPICLLYINAFNKAFKLDLCKNEQNIFLDALQNPDNHEKITNDLKALFDLLNSENYLKDIDVWPNILHPTKNIKKIPEVILVKPIENIKILCEIFTFIIKGMSVNLSLTTSNKLTLKKIDIIECLLPETDALLYNVALFTNENKILIVEIKKTDSNFIYSLKKYLLMK